EQDGLLEPFEVLKAKRRMGNCTGTIGVPRNGCLTHRGFSFWFLSCTCRSDSRVTWQESCYSQLYGISSRKRPYKCLLMNKDLIEFGDRCSSKQGSQFGELLLNEATAHPCLHVGFGLKERDDHHLACTAIHQISKADETPLLFDRWND